jgi:hypothetical protein
MRQGSAPAPLFPALMAFWRTMPFSPNCHAHHAPTLCDNAQHRPALRQPGPNISHPMDGPASGSSLLARGETPPAQCRQAILHRHSRRHL